MKLDDLRDNLDKVTALVGIIAGVVLTWVLWSREYAEVGIVLSLACIVYLLIANKVPQAFSSSKFQIGRRGHLISNIVFFSLFTYSIIAVLLNSELYLRPVGYFAATTVMVVLLAMEIMTLSDGNGKGHIYLTVAKVLLLGISLQWLPQAMFPSLTGVDVFGHSRAVFDMLSLGHIPPDFVYAKLPLMHLEIGMTSLVTGLDYKFAGMLSVGVFYLAIPVFIFLFIKQIFNTKLALLSMLITIISSSFIHYGLFVIPNTMGVALVMFLVYLVFRREKSVASSVLTLITMAALIMTHPPASFYFAILLVSMVVGPEIYHRFYKKSDHLKLSTTVISSTMPLLFIVSMLAYWMYVSGHIRQIGVSISYVFGLERQMGVSEAVQYLSRIPRSEILLDEIGMLLFYFLCSIGVLVLLSKGFRNPDRFRLVLSAGALTLAAFIALISGFSDFMPDRALTYTQVLFSPVAAMGILFFSGLFYKQRWRFAALILLVLPLAFFQITESNANWESPIYSPNLAYRRSFTLSEMQAADTIFQIYEGKVVTDSSYKGILREELDTTGITDYLVSKDFTEVEKLVVIREYSVEHTFWGGGGYLKVDYDPRTLLEEQVFSRIYDCGTVSAFLPQDRPAPESQ